MEASPYHFLSADANRSRGNVTAMVTDALRQAIVTLQLRPGEPIDKGLVCERLGVSRFPVSEALARLAAEGLVDIQPQRGSTVSLIKVSDVLEWMLIRKSLEAEAVRVVASPRDVERVAALKANLAAQRAAAKADAGQQFHELDVEFHELLLGDDRLEKLGGIIDQARANLDRARRLILDPRRLELTLREHLAIFAALDKADGLAAALAMRSHIDSVIGELLSFAHDHPALFADGEALRANPGYAAFPFG